MKNVEEDLEKLLKKVGRLDRKIDLMIEHSRVQITPEEEISKQAEFTTGIAKFYFVEDRL